MYISILLVVMMSLNIAMIAYADGNGEAIATGNAEEAIATVSVEETTAVLAAFYKIGSQDAKSSVDSAKSKQALTEFLNAQAYQPVKFTVEPVINESNRTLVPIRDICEKIGAQIQWEDKDQSIHIFRNGIYITLKIGEPNMKVQKYSAVEDAGRTKIVYIGDGIDKAVQDGEEAIEASLKTAPKLIDLPRLDRKSVV